MLTGGARRAILRSIMSGSGSGIAGTWLDRARGIAGRARPFVLSGPGLFWALLSLVLGLHLWSVWVVRWIPLGDLGGWIELMDVMGRYDDPRTMYGGIYELPRSVDPNSLAVYFGALVAPLVRADAAAKLLVSWYVVGIPLSMLALLRAFGRSRWLVFLASPLTFNALYNGGLLNYLIGMPLLFFGAALARRVAMRRGVLRAALLSVVLAGLFFSHALIFLIGWAVILAVFVLSVSSWRGALRAWAFAVPLPLFGFWYYRKFIALETTEKGLSLGTKEGFGFVFMPFDDRFSEAYTWGMRFFRDNSDEVLTIFLMVAWAALMLLGRSSMERGAEEGDAAGGDDRPGFFPFVRRHALELVTGCCLVAYFVMPSHMHEVQIIAERVVILVALLVAAWPRIDTGTRPVRVFIALAVVAALVYPVHVARKFEKFSTEIVGGLPEGIAALPDRTRMSYVTWDRPEPVTCMGAHWHIPKAIHAVENGGVTDDSFAERANNTVQYKKGKTPSRLFEQFWKNPHMRDYDYVLLYAAGKPEEALRQKSIELVFQDKSWYLFKVLPSPR